MIGFNACVGALLLRPETCFNPNDSRTPAIFVAGRAQPENHTMTMSQTKMDRQHGNGCTNKHDTIESKHEAALMLTELTSRRVQVGFEPESYVLGDEGAKGHYFEGTAWAPNGEPPQDRLRLDSRGGDLARQLLDELHRVADYYRCIAWDAAHKLESQSETRSYAVVCVPHNDDEEPCVREWFDSAMDAYELADRYADEARCDRGSRHTFRVIRDDEVEAMRIQDRPRKRVPR